MTEHPAGDRLVIARTPDQHAGEKYRAIDWSIARRLLQLMRRYPGLLRLMVIYAVVLSTINSIVPGIAVETIRWTIERPEELESRFSISPQQGVFLGAGAIAVFALLYYLVMALRIVAINRMAEFVVFDIRHSIFEHIQRLDMSFFDRTKLGRILSRATGDVQAVRTAVAEVVPRFLIHALMALWCFVFMLFYDWVTALLVCSIGVPLYLLNRAFRRRMGHAYRVVQETFSVVTANIAESVSGMHVTQAFNREERNLKMFRDLCLEHRRNNMHAAHIHGVYIPIFDITSIVVSVVVLIAGTWRIEAGAMTMADVLGFLFFTGNFFLSIIIIAELHNTTQQAMAGGERIFRLLDREPLIVDAPGALPLARGERGARIEFRDVVFGYNADTPVLHDVSFVADPGRTVALVGHTGSGKTSIINLVCRLYEFQRGSILIDRHDVRDITIDSLHAQTGLVLQDNFLFHGTVAQNIRFGRPDATDEDVRAACAALDCLEVLEGRLPQGLSTQVGERGSNLSAGQAQLVRFARAMLADPRILMLDEATSAVDTFTEYRIQLALEKLMEGRTCLVVAHRLSTVRRADTILVLEHGHIVERGTHDELMDQEGPYRELYDEFVRVSE